MNNIDYLYIMMAIMMAACLSGLVYILCQLNRDK